MHYVISECRKDFCWGEVRVVGYPFQEQTFHLLRQLTPKSLFYQSSKCICQRDIVLSGHIQNRQICPEGDKCLHPKLLVPCALKL